MLNKKISKTKPKKQKGGDTSALKNISIHIPSNTKACVSGNQGSGKSSLLRVMSGNFNDFEGNILINEVPLNNYNLELLTISIECFHLYL